MFKCFVNGTFLIIIIIFFIIICDCFSFLLKYIYFLYNNNLLKLYNLNLNFLCFSFFLAIKIKELIYFILLSFGCKFISDFVITVCLFSSFILGL